MRKILSFLILGMLLSCQNYNKESNKKADAEEQKHYPTQGSCYLVRFGQPRYGKDFEHFDYASPDAKEGGSLRLATVGSFDKINPYTLRGIPPFGNQLEGSLTRENLMIMALDDPVTKYPFIARSCKVAPDFSWIIFYVHPNIYCQDNTIINAQSLKQTIETLKTTHFFRNAYRPVEKVEVLDEFAVKIHFQPKSDGSFDEKMPLLMADLIPLSIKSLPNINKPHACILGAGPYYIASYTLGHEITYMKNKNYFAKHFPSRKGHYLFDKIKIVYYKNERAMLEGFKNGDFDVYFFTDPANFKNFMPPNQAFKKVEYAHKKPAMVTSIVLNMKNSALQDQRVRDALSLMLDFETINKICFHNQYKKATSLFENTEFKAPETITEGERAVLKQHVPQSFLTRLFSDNPNALTQDVRKSAEKLLHEAGFEYRESLHYRTNEKGVPLKFTMIINKPKLEKLVNIFKKNLETVGVMLEVKLLDPSVYYILENEKRYDMLIRYWNTYWSNQQYPSSEQISYFGKGQTLNYMNLDDDVAESLARLVASAQDYASLLHATRALDRYVVGKKYVLPLHYLDKVFLVYRKDRIDFDIYPEAGTNIMMLGRSVTH